MRPRAFTIIELLVVVCILAIAAMIVVPHFGTRDDLQAAAAARAVMADLMYAQNRAIATQKKHYVRYSGSSYTLYARDSDTTALYTLTQPITGKTYSVTLGSTNLDFPRMQIASISFDGSTQTAIQFDSLGLPSVYNATADTATAMANTGTITLATTVGSFSTAVTIDPTTGEATTH